MRNIPAALQAHLDSGATSMVHCWKITRTDGVVMGFTEHDRDITLSGVVYEADSGFTASKLQTSLGLAADNLNADGALSSDSISEEDLTAGRYDDAEVELYWVLHTDPTNFILLSKGNIGEVQRGEVAFSAEFRSLSTKLQQPTGRVYQRTCDAILGDNRCRVANFSSYQTNVQIIPTANDREFVVTGLAVTENDYYNFGLLAVTNGANDGLEFEIKQQQQNIIMLWEKPPFEITSGTTGIITAGCDKLYLTCRDKFSNTINFQGFPFIPGGDLIASVASPDSSQQGQSLVGIIPPPIPDVPAPPQLPPGDDDDDESP